MIQLNARNQAITFCSPCFKQPQKCFNFISFLSERVLVSYYKHIFVVSKFIS